MSIARKTLLAAGAVLVASSTIAAASGDHWRRKAIDTEQWRNGAQIEQGRYQGQLTRREYRQLLVDQARARELAQSASRDGYISKREFREVRSAQLSTGRQIAEDTSNRRKSWLRRLFYLTRY